LPEAFPQTDRSTFSIYKEAGGFDRGRLKAAALSKSAVWD